MISAPRILTIATLSSLLQLATPVQLAAQDVTRKAFSVQSVSSKSTLELTQAQQDVLKSIGFTDIYSQKTLAIYFELFIDVEMQILLENLQKTYFSADAKKQLNGETQAWVEEVLSSFYRLVYEFLHEKDSYKKLEKLEKIFASQDAIFLLGMVEENEEQKIFFREKRTGGVFQKIGAQQGEKIEALFDGNGEEGVQKKFQKAVTQKGEKRVLEEFQKIFGALAYYPKGVPQELYKKERVEVVTVEKTRKRAENRGYKELARQKKETTIANNGSFGFFQFFGLGGN